MRRALLILTASHPAVFSARAATEGQHQTLAHPTGAALLGWAASAGKYAKFKDPFAVFHSGRVRFSNALPLTADGCATYPVPRLLAAPKHGPGGVQWADPVAGAAGMLDCGQVSVGIAADERDDAGNKVQREFLKGLFVSMAGAVVKPATGARLRTATRDGRAADGQLFGYTHLDPKAASYAATIECEADAICDGDWMLLLAAFAAGPRLGRASGTAYGGGYACRVIDGAGAALWPLGAIAAGAMRVRVWALSDLALVDAHGAPCFVPSADMLGLPAGGTFHAAHSAIGVRRYAPWNAHLRTRDLERQVIEAGSVFTFTYEQPLAATTQSRAAVGQFQEAGLGRIVVAPALLDGAPGDTLVVADTPVPIAALEAAKATAAMAPPPSEVLQWLAAMDRLQRMEAAAP